MPARRRAFVLLYAASGAAALVYEITWTRLLTLVMGHTIAAASTVLAAFMGGLAVGSWLGARLESYFSVASEEVSTFRLRLYAGLELVIALSAMILPALLAASGHLLIWAYQDGQAPTRFSVVRVMLNAATPTIAKFQSGPSFGYVTGVTPARIARLGLRFGF